MKKKYLLTLVLALLMLLAGCDIVRNIMPEADESSGFYRGTNFPTFESVTGIACTKSFMDESGKKTKDGYVSGAVGYQYDDSGDAMSKYSDYLIHIGAKYIDESSIAEAIMVGYELDGETLYLASYVAEDGTITTVITP